MSERRPLIAANWKMHKTNEEAVSTVVRLLRLVGETPPAEVLIAPPFTALAPLGELLAASPIALGGQNLHWEEKGAFTGEISASMLRSAGCRYVIVGHSERRQYFGETDRTVNLRIRAALKAGLAPVLCVGESEAQRDAGETFSVLDKQVADGLKDFASKDLSALVMAYEPIWAIGTGKTATSDQAQEVHAYLRERVAETFGKALAKRVRILYGGSVKPDNIADLMARSDVDGALVGGASLEAESFSRIVNYPKTG